MESLKLTLDRNCIIALEKFHKGKTRAKSGKEQNEGQKREEKNAIAIRLLNEFQRAEVITLYIPDVAMLENSPEDGEEDFSSYRDRLRDFGLDVEASSIFKAALPVSLRQENTSIYRFEYGEFLRRSIQNTLFPCDAYDFAGHLECYCQRTGNDPQLLADVLEYMDVNEPEVMFPYEPQRWERLKQAMKENGESLKKDAKKCENAWMNRFCDVYTLYAHTTWGGHIFVTDDHNFIDKQHRLRKVGVRGEIMTPPDTVQYLINSYPQVITEKDPG